MRRVSWPAAATGLLALGGPRLLVASFNHLYWYFPRTRTHRLVHEGAGKYYGVAFGDRRGRRLLVVSRPDQERNDDLLTIDADSGRLLRTRGLASRDTHQAIRCGERLLVTDSFRGRLLEYALPALELARVHDDFRYEDHLNSVRAWRGRLFVLLHGFGRSWLAEIDAREGDVVHRWDELGTCSHDIVPWGGGLLVNDSNGGALLHLDLATGRTRTVWAEPGRFAKGLTRDGRLAILGLSPPAERERRYTVRCEFVAVDLASERVVWRRPAPLPGLVNAITTPRVLAREWRGAW
ncbi:MAG: hypothetical protein IT304_03835 [Dehalococcoidia bacterium]|nr:hypothetical protein [Dehalococcoidia bacterium]